MCADAFTPVFIRCIVNQLVSSFRALDSISFLCLQDVRYLTICFKTLADKCAWYNAIAAQQQAVLRRRAAALPGSPEPVFALYVLFVCVCCITFFSVNSWIFIWS